MPRGAHQAKREVARSLGEFRVARGKEQPRRYSMVAGLSACATKFLSASTCHLGFTSGPLPSGLEFDGKGLRTTLL